MMDGVHVACRFLRMVGIAFHAKLRILVRVNHCIQGFECFAHLQKDDFFHSTRRLSSSKQYESSDEVGSFEALSVRTGSILSLVFHVKMRYILACFIFKRKLLY